MGPIANQWVIDFFRSLGQKMKKKSKDNAKETDSKYESEEKQSIEENE